MIKLFKTEISRSSIQYVKEILQEGWVSEGVAVHLFENRFKELIQNKNTFVVNSGTSALHLALILAGVKTGDEVIIPSQTFIATGLAVKYVGAIPVLADVNPFTSEINIEDVKKKITNKTKAIIGVDWGGYPCNYVALWELAIPIIRDAAHSLLAQLPDYFIDFTCYSFQGIKHLTTGDGGAVSCFREKDYERGKKLRWFGIDREKDLPDETGERKYNLEEIGYKYHMNNVSAAIGLGQLETIEKEIINRQEIASIYNRELSAIPGLTLPNYSYERKSSYWLFPILVENRPELMKKLKNANIEASVVHQGIDRNKIFGGIDNSLVGQRRLDKTLLHIPIRGNLTDFELETIVDTIRGGW